MKYGNMKTMFHNFWPSLPSLCNVVPECQENGNVCRVDIPERLEHIETTWNRLGLSWPLYALIFMIIRQDVKTIENLVSGNRPERLEGRNADYRRSWPPSVSNFSTIFWSQDGKELSRNTWGHKSPWNQVIHDDLYGLWMALFYGLCH